MSFPTNITEGSAPAVNATRVKRQLVEQAIAATTAADWESAADLNRRILEMGPDSEAENRLAKAPPRQLAQVNPGDAVELQADGPRLVALANGVAIGAVEPRVAARLLKLIANGNKYAAGVTSLGDRDVRIIIRETYQDPRNYGKVSFPTAAKVTDLRPYTKGTLVREEEEIEDELELEDEDEIDDIGRVLAVEVGEEESFEEEPEEIDEES